MAPLKFEEHIKDKLEQRKLQPSADAWQKLNHKLDDDASKTHPKLFWWFGIAASIVGVLLVVTVFMNSENDKTLMPTIVDTENVDAVSNDEVIKEASKETPQEQNHVNDSKDKKESSIKNTEKSSTSKQPSLLKQKLNKEQHKLVPSKTNNAVATTKLEVNDHSEVEKANTIIVSDEELKIQAVVAEMQKLQEQSKSALDSELDALLGEAQKEIALEKLYREAIKTVDADALLQDVEQDIDVSFRDRVFKALKDSYKTVKTAVAERNN